MILAKVTSGISKKKKLVEGLSERELTNPEGTGFDLRLEKFTKFRVKRFSEKHTARPLK